MMYTILPDSSNSFAKSVYRILNPETEAYLYENGQWGFQERNAETFTIDEAREMVDELLASEVPKEPVRFRPDPVWIFTAAVFILMAAYFIGKGC